jgi:Ca2+-binding RTX toxin-like protein
LWQTDGTVDGTRKVQMLGDINTSLPNTYFQMSQADDKLLILRHERSVLVETLVFDPATMVGPVGPNRAKITLVDAVLRIFGTQDSDNIRIYRHQESLDRFVVSLNGVKRSFSLSQVNRIHIYGYSGDDNIAVNERLGRITLRSRIWGGGGNDLIFTGSARDTLYGEAGDDVINSGRNADVAMGGVGDDWLYGGLHSDTVSGEEGADTVNGAGGADLVSGGDDQSDDQLDGGAGIDVIFGRAVYEVFYAGAQGEDPSGLDELLLMA